MKLLNNKNNTKMKQGNPTKRFGLVALIGAMIAGLTSKPKGVTTQDLQARRLHVLINGGVAPIPHRIPNQRQRRKLAAQMR